MTPKITAQVGLVLLISAIIVLLISIYQSSHGGRSMGLSSLGTVLLVLGIGLRVRSRRVGGE